MLMFYSSSTACYHPNDLQQLYQDQTRNEVDVETVMVHKERSQREVNLFSLDQHLIYCDNLF